MNTPRRIIAILLILSMGEGCSGPTAKTALDTVVVFIRALNLLKEGIDLYKSRVSDAVQVARADLRRNDRRTDPVVKLQTAAMNWEESWKRVSVQMTELERRFHDVEAAAGTYWRTLDEVTSGIKDERLRKQEIDKNKQLKQKWDASFRNAQLKIAQAHDLQDKGEDLRRMLIAAALRHDIAEYTNALDSIAEEAESLLGALEELVEQGQIVLSAS